jgi:hypothetical protein
MDALTPLSNESVEILVPALRARQHKIYGTVQAARRFEQASEVLARLDRARPQDVGTVEAVACSHARHVALGRGNQVDAEWHEAKACVVEPGIPAIANGRLRRAQDDVGFLKSEREATFQEAHSARCEVRGISLEGEIVDGHH